jgi:hypothetical protein
VRNKTVHRGGHLLRNGRRCPMPQEPTKNRQRTMTGYAQSNHEADASSVQRWEPGLKPSRMTGYSLSVGHRHTWAMLPTPLRRVSPKLDVPTWHRRTASLCWRLTRAIEVVLSLKTGKSQLNSTIPPTNRLSVSQPSFRRLGNALSERGSVLLRDLRDSSAPKP